MDIGLIGFKNNGQIDINNDTTVYINKVNIGDKVGGGIVFYTGDTILIVGEDNLSTPLAYASPSNTGGTIVGFSQYGCQGILKGATGTTIGTGLENSLLTYGCKAGPGYGATGITTLCTNLILSGYTDWYCPSLDELLEIWYNRSVIPNLTLTSGYGSSSEYDLNDFWEVIFTSNPPNRYIHGPKYDSLYVRPIRKLI